MPTTRRITHIGFCAATILLAFGLRAYRLGTQSIWYDEALSVHYARQPLPELLRLVATSDHPPLYFLLLHAWLRLGAFGRPTVEFLVRFPSLLAGVLLVPVAYVLGRRLLTPRAAILAAFLTAVSPFHVWYAQETRMYTLAVLLTALASYVLLRALLRAAYEPPVRLWSAYAFLIILALYTHFYTTFILLAHFAFVAWYAWREGGGRVKEAWRVGRPWAVATLAAVAFFLPWGSRAAGQLQANDTYWRGTLDLGRTVVRTAQALTAGETLGGVNAAVVTGAYLLLAGIGCVRLLTACSAGTWRVRLQPRAVAVFLAGYVLIPLLALLAIAYNRPKFAPRYLLTVAPALALLAASGVTRWPSADGRRQVAGGRWQRVGCQLPSALSRLVTANWTLVGIAIAGSGLSLWHHYFDPALYKPDWRAAAEYIADHAGPRDAVVIVAGHTAPAFAFYNRRGLEVYPIPPQLLPHVSDPVETAEVAATLNRLVEAGHDRVWLILWQEPLADPRRITLEQLFDHGERLGVNAPFHDLGVLLFRLPPGTRFGPPQPQHPLRARFGDAIELYGYDLWPETVRPGEELTLRLYWRATAPVDRDYTAFTQLLTPDDRIVGQHDRKLGGDLYPTSRWPVGEPVRETYKLRVASDAPPGPYRLIAGVYLRETGERLPVRGDRAHGDYVLVMEVR